MLARKNQWARESKQLLKPPLASYCSAMGIGLTKQHGAKKKLTLQQKSSTITVSYYQCSVKVQFTFVIFSGKS